MKLRRSYSPRRSQSERLRLRFRFRGPGGGLGGRFCAAGQDGFKLAEKFGDVAPANDERREKPEDVAVGAIDQQSLPKRFGDERSALDRKIEAKDQSFATHFADEIETRRKFFESGAELGAALANVVEQFFIFDDVEEFERRGADQRAAAKCRAVHSGAERGSEFFVGDERTQRKASRERLGDGYDVGKRAEFLVRETPAGAAQTGLDFIGDQCGAMLCGQLARPVPELIADNIDAALTLNRFDDDGA